MDPELNNKDLRIYISATKRISKNASVEEIIKRTANRMKVRSERTAQFFQEKDRAKVLGLYVQKVVESPVTFKDAKASAIETEVPSEGSLKPSKPELLDSAAIYNGIFICVNMTQPGICYQLMYQGEKSAFKANKETVMKAFKTIKFLRH